MALHQNGEVLSIGYAISMFVSENGFLWHFVCVRDVVEHLACRRQCIICYNSALSPQSGFNCILVPDNYNTITIAE
jgi:hypothetical protein